MSPSGSGRLSHALLLRAPLMRRMLLLPFSRPCHAPTATTAQSYCTPSLLRVAAPSTSAFGVVDGVYHSRHHQFHCEMVHYTEAPSVNNTGHFMESVCKLQGTIYTFTFKVTYAELIHRHPCVHHQDTVIISLYLSVIYIYIYVYIYT